MMMGRDNTVQDGEEGMSLLSIHPRRKVKSDVFCTSNAGPALVREAHRGCVHLSDTALKEDLFRLKEGMGLTPSLWIYKHFQPDRACANGFICVFFFLILFNSHNHYIRKIKLFPPFHRKGN